MATKTKPLTARITEKTTTKLKVYCARNKLKIQNVVEDALVSWLNSEREHTHPEDRKEKGLA